MKNKWILGILICLIAFAASSAMALDLSKDWSSVNNPNGEWSYGWLSSDCNLFTPYNVNSGDSTLSNWQMDSGDFGMICKAGLAGYKGGNVYLESNQVVIIGSNQISAVRWLASTPGAYTVNVHYTAQNILGSNSIVYILKKNINGTLTYFNSKGSKGDQLKGFIGASARNSNRGFGKSREYLYESVINIADGDALYFAVYNHLYDDDVIGLQVTIDSDVVTPKLKSDIAAAFTITGTASPHLGSTNYMANGDIETGSGGIPNVWQAYAAGPGVINSWSTFAYSGSKSLYTSIDVPTSYGSWAGGSRVIVPAAQELLFSYYINMPSGMARPYAVCFYDVNGDGTNNLTDYEQYLQGFTTAINPLYSAFIDDLSYFSDKHLSTGWNRVSKIISARTMNFSTAGAIFQLYYADPGGLETPSEMWIDKTYLGMTNVNLTVNIYGTIANIAETKVYNDENVLVYTVPSIPASGTVYSFTIPVLADSLSYKAVVKDKNGVYYNKVISY